MAPHGGLLESPITHFVLVLLGWGLSEYFMVLSGKKLPVAASMFYNCVGLTLINLPNYSHVQDFGSVSTGCLMAASTGIFYGIGDVCFFKLAHGPSGAATKSAPDTFSSASVLAPICGLYVIIPVVLGVLIQHEPLTLQKVVGLTMAITAIYLLSDEDDDDSDSEEDDGEGNKGEKAGLLASDKQEITDWSDLSRDAP